MKFKQVQVPSSNKLNQSVEFIIKFKCDDDILVDILAEFRAT